MAVAVVLCLTTTALYAIDRDNNPPGLRGGPGTNWENPPGPGGGPGASPNRHPFWQRHRVMMHQRLLQKFDTDGDGALSATERQAMHEALENHRSDVIDKFDTDSDGKLSPAERDAVREAAKEHFVEKFDKDGDGKLSPSERPSRIDRDNNPPGPRGGPGTNWENRPGPRGGPGASPDRVNRPGPRGGRGRGR